MAEKISVAVVPKTSIRTDEVELKPSIGFNRVFIRLVVPQAEIPHLLDSVKKNLFLGDSKHTPVEVNQQWFDSLKPVDKPFEEIIKKWDYPGLGQKVYPVAIKDTKGIESEGLDYSRVRDSLSRHHKAVRSGDIVDSKYRLHIPRPYGVLDDRFLVMEWIPEIRCYRFNEELVRKAMSDNSVKPILYSYQESYDQYHSNMQKLVKEKKIETGHFMQLSQAMVAGHTNPKDLKNGKWVFFHSL